MIDNFLRPPAGVAGYVADALRVFGLFSVLFAAVFLDLTDAGILAFTLPGLVLPRFIGVRAWADVFVSVTLLVAAWSNVFDLYTTLPSWDLFVHFVCAGVLAAGLYLLLARMGMVPVPMSDPFQPVAAVVLTTSFGLALGSLWEIVEWLGFTFITTDIFVTYQDTIGDMVVGGLGALAFGFLVARVPLLRETTPAAPAATAARAPSGSVAATRAHDESR